MARRDSRLDANALSSLPDEGLRFREEMPEMRKSCDIDPCDLIMSQRISVVHLGLESR